MSSRKDAGTGIVCPRCFQRQTHVTHTKRKAGIVRRRRVCYACNHAVWTTEAIGSFIFRQTPSRA
jgi:transcriptional regulator NrdR family protein